LDERAISLDALVFDGVLIAPVAATEETISTERREGRGTESSVPVKLSLTADAGRGVVRERDVAARFDVAAVVFGVRNGVCAADWTNGGVESGAMVGKVDGMVGNVEEMVGSEVGMVGSDVEMGCVAVERPHGTTDGSTSSTTWDGVLMELERVSACRPKGVFRIAYRGCAGWRVALGFEGERQRSFPNVFKLA